MNDTFTGFTPETFKFFNELKENNYKPWFDEHKPVYEQEILRPLRALVTAMTPAMYSIDSQMDFRPNKIISRIYRDIRFSHNKLPYKTSMWFTFQRMVADWVEFPGYYLEVGSEGYQYGMGLFMAKKKTMDAYRSRIEYEPEQFKKMTEALTGKHGFIMGGEEYKRPVSNDLPEYFQPWVQRRTIYLYKSFPVGKELFDAGFVQRMADEFTHLQPFYDFLIDVCE
jgi:uncharacterized protein (TIGR02453 family)